MTVPSWPLTLPQSPLVDSWEESPQAELIIGSVDSGDPPIRGRGTGIYWAAKGEWHFSNLAQYSAFWTFYNVTVKRGLLAFSWTHPVLGGTYVWKFDPTAGSPVLRALAQDKHRATLSFIRYP